MSHAQVQRCLQRFERSAGAGSPLTWLVGLFWCAHAAPEEERLDAALASIASLQVLGCDADTLAAYDGADRFGIHLDDLCDVPDPSAVQARAHAPILAPASALSSHIYFSAVHVHGKHDTAQHAGECSLSRWTGMMTESLCTALHCRAWA